MTDLKIAYEKQSQTIIRAFLSRQMNGYYVSTKEEAKEKALSLIQTGATVSYGGSKTLDAIGIKRDLQNGDYQFIDRARATTEAEKKQCYRDALSANYYLTSTNAFTLEGHLVNIDGNGNRVAALSYGPDQVIVIVGMNKLCTDVPAAINRVRNVAAPPNTMRLGMQTPCSVIGFCKHCKSEDCICCSILVTRFCRDKNRFHIILVGEPLGF